ncbi:hypothetical protein LINGRAHAP2_LOCUS18000, partial [Linum grandiflorum]
EETARVSRRRDCHLYIKWLPLKRLRFRSLSLNSKPKPKRTEKTLAQGVEPGWLRLD